MKNAFELRELSKEKEMVNKREKERNWPIYYKYPFPPLNESSLRAMKCFYAIQYITLSFCQYITIAFAKIVLIKIASKMGKSQQNAMSRIQIKGMWSWTR